MPLPKLSARAFDALGAVAAFFVFLGVLAIAPTFAFTLACVAIGVIADAKLDVFYVVRQWWRDLRGRFSA